MTNLLPNLLPIPTNTPILGETEPNPTPTHAPNLEECGRYTLYARNPNPHCTGQLTNYFSCPNIKVVLRGLYETKPKMLSDVELDAKGDGGRK